MVGVVYLNEFYEYLGLSTSSDTEVNYVGDWQINGRWGTP